MFTDKKQKIVKKEISEFKIKYGFLDRFNNTTLFINLSTWVRIISDDDYNFTKEFDKIGKQIKSYLHENLPNKLFDNTRYLVDVDIRRNGLNSTRPSYLEIEITLASKNTFIPDNELGDAIEKIINDIRFKHLYNNSLFKYTLTKKEKPTI